MARTWTLLSLVVLVLTACGGGAERAKGTIGPEGGTIAVEDATSGLNGFSIDVPEGAVLSPTSFAVTEIKEGSDLPDLPPGFAAFNPVLKITADAALEGKVLLRFPVGATPADPGQVPTAFFLDETTKSWVMVLPKTVADERMTVETSHFSIWRWGVTLLEAADKDALVASMIELYGTTIWEDLKEGFQQQFDTTYTVEVFDAVNWSNCDKLLALGSYLKTLGDTASAELQASLNASCGACSIGADVFIDELGQYIHARVKQFMVEQIVEAMDFSFLMGLALKLNVAVYYEDVVKKLSCDYKCLLDNPPPGMWGNVATYYMAVIASVLVELGYRSDGCG